MEQPKKMKLYRYRPLTEVLFKELLYSEIYLASPRELNDPLDLNGQLNFFTESEEKIRALARFLSKRILVLHLTDNRYGSGATKRLMDLLRCDGLEQYISAEFRKFTGSVVAKNDLFEILLKFLNENALIDKDSESLSAGKLFSSLDELFSQFLSNSSVACFSKSCTNFLMWSHYASGHTGICLEFEVDIDPTNRNVCSLPLHSRAPLNGKYIEWKEDVKAVQYPASLSNLHFYDYLPIFGNMGDTDLMNLSKSYWHPYAEGIKNLFLEKLRPWRKEEEWRIVRVSFQEEMPEDRLLKFNDKALTGVFFGAKASGTTQTRVRNILEETRSIPVFYKCSVDGTRGVEVAPVSRAAVGS